MPGGGDLEVQVALEVQNLAVISYGYSGTARKLVERIAVVNTGGAASAGTLVRPRVRVAAQLAEPLVTEWTGAAKALPAPGAPEITWDDAANPLNKKLIASIRQAPPADLVVEILAGEATVGSFQMPLTVLLPNQWMHAPDCFEALAGFVNHNDPALHAVMKQANALLKQRTKLPESLGYRRDAEHVQQVVGAVFDALSALGIEEVGGTFGVEDTIYAMRPLAAILGGKRATALELVLVVAACLAKAKLDPVIIFAGTTVYAGYALIPDQADARWDAGEQAKLWARLTPYAVVEYQKALAKLLSLGLVQVLDTVGAIGDGGPQARTADGKQRHVDVDPAGLQTMVVVRKAWESGISFAPAAPSGGAEAPPAEIEADTSVYRPPTDEANPAPKQKSKDKTPRELESNLYQQLMASQFSFMGKARSSIGEIYDRVKTQYPSLCDDTYYCSENCRSGANQPEWHHTVRRALNYLRNIKDNPVCHSGQHGYWEILRRVEPQPELEEQTLGGHTPASDEGKHLPDADHEAAPGTGESVSDGPITQVVPGTADQAERRSSNRRRDYTIDPLTAAELLMIAEAVEVDPVIWLAISHWAKVTGNLKPYQRGLLYDVGKLRENGREPSFKQAYWALIALKEAYSNGFKSG